MKQFRNGWLALLSIIAGVGPLAAQPTFHECRLNLRTEAQIAPLDYQWRTAISWVTGAYADDNVNCAVSASTDNGSVTAVASSSMSWQSNGQGRVTFADTGFVWAVFGQTGAADLDESAWSYTFTTGDDQAFKVRYGVGIETSSVEEPFVHGFTLLVYQDQDVIFSQDMDLDTNGFLQAPLSPGQTYTAVIRPNAAFSTSASLGICTMWGDFHWRID